MSDHNTLLPENSVSLPGVFDQTGIQNPLLPQQYSVTGGNILYRSSENGLTEKTVLAPLEVLSAESVAWGGVDEGGEKEQQADQLIGQYSEKTLVGNDSAPKTKAKSTKRKRKNRTKRHSIDVDLLFNGVDADRARNALEIGVGETVDWTFQVTNTGKTPYDFHQVHISNSHLAAAPEFDPNSDAGGDRILSPGEEWIYKATTIAEELSVVLDFEADSHGNALAPGTVIDNEFKDWGLRVSTPRNHFGAMIFDSAHPSKSDQDLGTPNVTFGGPGIGKYGELGQQGENGTALDNILIISQDGNSSVPNDSKRGGILRFDWDSPVEINHADFLDLESGRKKAASLTFYNPSHRIIDRERVTGLGDNAFQRTPLDQEHVSRLDIRLKGEGALTELSFERLFKNVTKVTAGKAKDRDLGYYRNGEESLPQNMAPDLTVPGTQSVLSGSELSLTGIDLTDVDASEGILSGSITALNGVVQFAADAAAGITILPGSEPGTVAFEGTLNAINAALDGLTYQSNAGFVGKDTLTFTINDQGNSGDGGPLSDTEMIEVAVLPIKVDPLVVQAGLANDTGLSGSDRVTADATITGTITGDGAIASFRAGFGDFPGVEFVDVSEALTAEGAFSLSPELLAMVNDGTLSDGTYTLNLQAIDDQGNVSGLVTVPFVLDTTAPDLGLGLAEDSDSPPIGDQQTIEETVTLTGSTEAGLTVTLESPNGETVAGETGDFTFANVALGLGENTFTATATDLAGNTGSGTTFVTRLPVDTESPIISVGLVNDTGIDDTDRLTFDPTIQGTVSDENGVASLKAGFGETLPEDFVDITATLQNGAFVLDAATLETINGEALSDGLQTLNLVATDALGNESEVLAFTFTLDTGLTPLTLDLAAASDSGDLGDQQTTFETVTLEGVTEPNVQVELEGTELVASVDSSGVFSFSDVSLAEGENPFTVTATDAAGNVATTTTTITRTVPQVDAPTIQAALANDTGSDGTDGLTLDPTITGQIESELPIVTLQGSLNGGEVLDVSDALNGDAPNGGTSFTLTLDQYERLIGGAMLNENYTVVLTAVDESGQTSDPVEVSFTLDRTPPAIDFDLAPESDTGVLGDGVTAERVVTLVGQTEPNLPVILVGSGQEVTADSEGNFAFTDVAMPIAGTVPFTVVTVDEAGNQGQLQKSLTRDGVNGAPTITSTPEMTFNASVQGQYSYQVEATDPDRDELTYRLISAPSGTEIDTQTGLISFTPSGVLLSEYDFAVEVTDDRGGSDIQEFTVVDPSVIDAIGEIRGIKWNDLNGNGVRDENRSSGTIVVNHDEWTLSDTGFIQSPDAEEFVQNLTAWFTDGSTGKFHAYSNNFGLTGTSLATAVENANHTWTVGTDIDFTLETLREFDGIFLAGAADVDTDILISYVNSGGNVYLIGGSGITGNLNLAATEANFWNPFLNEFGLEFASSHSPSGPGGFNAIQGNLPLVNSHPIFAGVETLFQDNGSSIFDLEAENSNNQILQTANGQGTFAIYSASQLTEPGLAGVSIYLDTNDNGVLDSDEPVQVTAEDDPSTPTDETGQYAFTNLAPGTYQVREVVPDGFVQTFPANVENGFYTVDLDEGEVVEDIDFGNAPVSGGEIRGTKWNDLNGNGVRDGSQGRIVVAHDVNTLSSSLAGEEEVRFSTNVAEWLIGDRSGRILAIESNPLDSDRDYASTVEAELISEGFDLTVTQDTTLSLTDLNEYDAIFLGQTFPNIAAVENQVLIDYVNDGGNVYLYGGVGPIAAQESSNWDDFLNAFGLDFDDQYNGVFTDTPIDSDHPIFDGISALGSGNGQFVIDLEPSDPRNQILQSTSDDAGFYAVFDPASSSEDLEPGLAGVSIYLDTNSNGILDSDEPVQVTAADDLSTPEDEAGQYVFTNLAPGTYQVREVVPDGFVQTFPSTDFYTVELEAGEVIDSIDFGNQLNAGQNRSPLITSTSPIATVINQPYQYQVEAEDPDGDSLTYTLVSAPDGMEIDELGQIVWQPTRLESISVEIEVSDGNGGITTQRYDLEVVEEIVDTEAPDVDLGFNRSVLTIGETLTLQVQGTDNVGLADLDLSFDGTSLALNPDVVTNGAVNTASITPDSTGLFDVIATATDTSGNIDTETVQIRVIDPTDTTPPVVEVATDQLNPVITELTDFSGTISGDTAFYRVEMAPVNSIDLNNLGDPNADYILLAEGTGDADGVLAQIDPNLYRNDSYYVRIYAEDASGNGNIEGVILGIDSQTKPGEFTQTFTDLSIPLTGLPIEIQRTYSSFDANRQGDFGFGWSLGVQDADIVEASPDGRDLMSDNAFGGNSFTVGTRVTLTTPDGDRAGFTFDPTLSAAGFLGAQFAPTFTADPGVDDRLEVDFVPLSINSDGSTGLYLFGTAFNPSQYRLITKEGITYRYDQNQGLLDVTDRNGNVLTYEDSGITSSTGQSIEFVRDDLGRIDEIIDPEGNVIDYEYNANGDLISVSDRNRSTTQLRYDDPDRDHYLTEIVDPLGRTGIRTEYDDQGQIERILDADGNALALDYSSIDSTQTVTDPFGNTTTFVLDEQGNVEQEVDALGGITRRVFDADNNLREETDPEGNTTRYTYDDRGNILTETDPKGNTTTFTYNGFSQILTEEDALGNVTTNTYDAQGNLEVRQDAEGNITRYGYDTRGLGLLTSITDANNNETRFDYDGFGNLRELTDPTEATYSFTYDANGNPETLTDPLNNEFVTRYDDEGRITERIDALNNVSITEYNAFGDKTADIDALGNRTEYVYSDRGLLTATIFPDDTPNNPNDNDRITNTYDALDRLISVTDEANRVTRYEYDALGRQRFIIYPDDTPGNPNDNPRTEFKYDGAGRLIEEIDELGNRTQFDYDGAGNRILSQDALGNETRFTYDAANRLRSQTDAFNRTTEFVYDNIGQQIEIRYADGTTSSTYDGLGNIKTETDQENNTTTFDYDERGRLIGVIDALGNTTTYDRNLVGNILTQEDANGNVTSFEYDELDRRIAIRLPSSQESTTTYDAVGNVKTVTDFNNETIEYDYDERNRLITTTLPDGEVEQFTYTPTGQLDTVTDALGFTNYEYDERDRLLSRENPDGRTITYTYDDAGNIRSLEVPSGTTTYTYDDLNRIDTVTDPDGGETRYTYDNVGNLTQTDFANGVVETREYDNLYRLERLENRDSDGVVLSSYDYELDAVGNRTQVTEADGRVVQYDYDDLYRLEAETIIPPGETTRTIEYSFDEVGNRLTRIDSVEGTTTYQYDDNDRLFAETLNGLTTEYRYDDDGNLTAKLQNGENQATYEWNTKGELTAVNINENGETGRIEYEYNHEGVRVSLNVNGEETRFLIDDNQQTYAQVIEEYTSNGDVQTSYVHGWDLISQEQNGDRSFYQVDGLGSTRSLTDETGALTDEYTYDAYGQLTGQSGSTSNNYLFAGEQFDENVDGYYLRARYYDPVTGRFNARDLFEGFNKLPITLHDFIYAGNNPITFIDPSGEVLIERAKLEQFVAGLSSGALAATGRLTSYVNQFSAARQRFSLERVFGAATNVVNSTPLRRFGREFERVKFFNTEINAIKGFEEEAALDFFYRLTQQTASTVNVLTRNGLRVTVRTDSGGGVTVEVFNKATKILEKIRFVAN